MVTGIPTEGRIVVLLCGPPGAGKTTEANRSGLEVWDRDDPCWSSERHFTEALARVGRDPLARCVVIRSAASSSARAKAAALVQATHIYLLTADPKELGHRVSTRAQGDVRSSLAGIKSWYDRHDRADHVAPFPGWDAIVPTTQHARPDLGSTSRAW